MSDTLRNSIYFALVALLIIGTGILQSWNSALFILNMGLISAIMALGVNLQWGFAGLFNVGIMGFVALGGLATVLISMPPVEGARPDRIRIPPALHAPSTGGIEISTVAKPPSATNPMIPTLKRPAKPH